MRRASSSPDGREWGDARSSPLPSMVALGSLDGREEEGALVGPSSASGSNALNLLLLLIARVLIVACSSCLCSFFLVQHCLV